MEQLDGSKYLSSVFRLMNAKVVQIRRLQLPKQLQILVTIQHEYRNVFLYIHYAQRVTSK